MCDIFNSKCFFFSFTWQKAECLLERKIPEIVEHDVIEWFYTELNKMRNNTVLVIRCEHMKVKTRIIGLTIPIFCSQIDT